MDIWEKLASRDNRSPGDFERDGILVCGHCGQPKQFWLEERGIRMLLPITCACEEREMREERTRQELEQFRLDMAAAQEKFGITDTSFYRMTFESDDGHNAKASAVCRRYVDKWESVRKGNYGILFYGTVGTGKSFLACSIVNALLAKGVRATVTNFPRLLNLLQSARDRQEIIDHLQFYELLAIDDLGVERDSGYATEQIFGVIDARARSGLPLIVTTNLTLDELTHPPTMHYQRIYDRVLDLCPVRLKLIGASRRAGNAEARREKARELLLDEKVL